MDAFADDERTPAFHTAPTTDHSVPINDDSVEHGCVKFSAIYYYHLLLLFSYFYRKIEG